MTGRTARRGLQVLAATAVIVAVGMLARPPDVAVPEPFEIERATPRPRATAEPPPRPEWSRSPAAVNRAAVVMADPRTLAPTGDRFEFDASRGLLASEIGDEGRWLALVTTDDGGSSSTVRLVDTEDLAAPPVEVTLPVVAEGIRLLPGGAGFVWFGSESSARTPWTWAASAGMVRLPSTGGPVPVPAVSLPADFQPWDVAPLDGERIGLFGYRVPPAPPTPGTPQARADLRVVVVDAAGGEVTTDIAVPAAADGAGGTPADDVPADVPPDGDVAWDAARQRAYVVGPRGAGVAVLDLDAGTIAARVPLAPPSEPAAPTPGSGAPALAGGWLEPVLSPDGGRLYVGGYATVQEAPGGPPDLRHLPLQVFDAEAGRTLDLGDTPAAQVRAVSPDGQHVLAVAGRLDAEVPQTLLLLDARTLVPLWRRQLEGVGVFGAAFSAGAEHVVTVEAGGQQPPRMLIEVFDAATGEQIASRSYDRVPASAHPTAAGIAIVFGPGA